MNINALKSAIPKGSVALIVSETNRQYFTDFSASDGFLLVSQNGAKIITDGRYIEAAIESIKDIDVVLLETGKLYGQINDILKEFGAEKVMVEASRITVSELRTFKEKLNIPFDESDSLDEIIDSLRIVKNDIEKEKIQKAQNIAEEAFEKILPMIKVGVKERDVAAALDYEMRMLGSDGVSFEPIVVAGVNSSKPHGVPSDNRIKDGDFVTLDFGAIFEGYHSDTTRTVAVGKITPKMANVYDIVLKSQLAGVEMVKSGVKAKDVDALCRNIISDAGYGEYFTHSTGHGVGVEIHELPRLSTRVDDKVLLSSGNVITVEPGIYIAGEFGVRIEDMLMVTDEGSYNFVSLQKELITL